MTADSKKCVTIFKKKCSLMNLLAIIILALL